MQMRWMAAASMLVLAACGGGNRDEQVAEPILEADANQDIAEGVATALYTFDCGTIEVSDLDIFAMDGSYSGLTDTFTDSCFLIRHPKGDLLWDLGLPAALVGANQTDGPFTVSVTRSLVDQLSDIGVSPRDIEYVSVSHHHFDHVGQPEAAGEATWLVHEDEYAAITADPAPGDFAGFSNFEVQAFTGNYDVFGDGAIRIMEMPGHTAGHTVLLVNLAEAGPVLLTGDMYHRAESRDGQKVPSFNFDAEQTRESIERFEALADASGAMVIIQHEPDDVARLPKLPEALR